jgi:hypothetical protein
MNVCTELGFFPWVERGLGRASGAPKPSASVEVI